MGASLRLRDADFPFGESARPRRSADDPWPAGIRRLVIVWIPRVLVAGAVNAPSPCSQDDFTGSECHGSVSSYTESSAAYAASNCRRPTARKAASSAEM